ncbi:MAG: FtsH protease activity modulator HflK [Acidobacteriota bacterium]|nr:FtsH protease activity modulator HflK [Acidobacteriota bacterium]
MNSGPRRVQTPEIVIQRMSNIPRGFILLAIAGLALLILAFNMFYTVQPEEQAILLRFGGFTGDIYEPGLNWKLPFIDKVYKVPTRRQLKMEFGFRTARAGQRTRYEARDFPEESLMLSGDLNVADVEWIVQYKIGNPYFYKFRVFDVEETFSDMSEAVMRQIVGDHSVDEVITIGRTKVASDAKELLQELCDRYETGIRVEQVVLQDVNPPQPVQASFNEVNESIQERERSINQAWAEYNKAVPRARGEAEQTIRQAEGYALERVNNSQGDASRFLALYAEYRKAPDVTRRRLYLETIERLLPTLDDKIIIDENLKNLLPLLNLGGGDGIKALERGQKGGS